MDDFDEEILGTFIEESRDHLATIENDLLLMEKAGADIDENLVNKVFRAAHSLKGGAGFFSLTKIKELAHRIESVLDLVRSRRLIPSSEVINSLLLAFDKLRELVNDVHGSNGVDIDEYVTSLGLLTNRPQSPPPTSEPTEPFHMVPTSLPNLPGGDQQPVTVQHIQTDPQTPLDMSSAQAVPSGPTETSLRVNVNLLESLMNLAGELVLSRNQLMEAMAHHDERALRASSQRVNLVTSELQETIMLTRMQPVGNVFNKFPRVVRDLAKDLGKEVRLDLTGKEVELDKTIIEGLSDPLTHLVRNAVDHGIETSSERTRTGKDPIGLIKLRAYHEAGQVNIEVSDDGKGLASQKIAAAAVSKGLITVERVKTMSEKEMMSLVFLPGLSTAEKVSDVSGRGVGMDVVKTNLDRLGGQVDIESVPGRGSTFRIKLPLTLAIIPCLLVWAGGERFAISQGNVDELIRVRAAKVKEMIELVGDAEVLVLRGKLIPIIDLAEILGIPSTFTDPADGTRKVDRRRRLADRRSTATPLFEEQRDPLRRGYTTESAAEARRKAAADRRFHAASDLNIVVVTTGIFQYGLVVEDLNDTMEIVVKPLGRHLKHIKQYAGATIMGDGRIALILDVAGLAQAAGLSSLAGTVEASRLAKENEKGKYSTEVQPLLIFNNSPNEQCAIPLGLVERVELTDKSDIEIVGGKRIMKTGGETIPLFELKDAANVRDLPQQEKYVVILFRVSGRQAGLLATAPVDAIEERLTIDGSTVRQTGIMGTSVIAGKTTLIVDVFELVGKAYPERPLQTTKESESAVTVLLAEDSDFFRKQVGKFLEDEGLTVMAAEDGLCAWEVLEKNGDRISMVVTDIEMPRLDGYGLTKKIRADERFSSLPVMALTSLAGEEDMARGREAGVNDYQIKLDRDSLIDAIHRLLHGHPGSLPLSASG